VSRTGMHCQSLANQSSGLWEGLPDDLSQKALAILQSFVIGNSLHRRTEKLSVKDAP